MSILDRIRNAEDYKEQYLRVFLYGGMRSGKTTSAASFPNPFLIGAPNENGVQTLRGRGDINYVVPGESDLTKTIDEMNEFLSAVHADAARMSGPDFRAKWGDTFIWDSISHYGDAVVNQLTTKKNDRTGELVRVDPNQQTWGILRTHLTNVRDVLFRLPCHVVITALDDSTQDEKGNTTWQGPRVQGAAGDLIPSSCELVGFCDSVGPETFVIYFQKYGKAEAGSRLKGMKPCMLRVSDTPGKTLWDQLAPYLPQNQQRA